MKNVQNFCKKNQIKLIGNHMIYFIDVDDYVVGVLAEDTNYLVRNLKSKKDVKQASENLKLLRSFL